jgi:hypothetical protein
MACANGSYRLPSFRLFAALASRLAGRGRSLSESCRWMLCLARRPASRAATLSLIKQPWSSRSPCWLFFIGWPCPARFFAISAQRMPSRPPRWQIARRGRVESLGLVVKVQRKKTAALVGFRANQCKKDTALKLDQPGPCASIWWRLHSGWSRREWILRSTGKSS